MAVAGCNVGNDSFFLCSTFRNEEYALPISTLAAAVRAILSAPDRGLDYLRAKLALDAIVDPAVDTPAVVAELEAMREIALRLAGPAADDGAKLSALRRLIYESGPWNRYRPFAYDHANLRGANVRVKLISHYLETRLGDCVSMPLLFLILADRMGLNVALSTAPFHVFVRHIDAAGRVTNFETTSGANPARDEWMRRTRPMSDLSIRSGLYMRTLSPREGVALMATTVLQYLMDSRRFEEAVEVAHSGDTIPNSIPGTQYLISRSRAFRGHNT